MLLCFCNIFKYWNQALRSFFQATLQTLLLTKKKQKNAINMFIYKKYKLFFYVEGNCVGETNDKIFFSIFVFFGSN